MKHKFKRGLSLILSCALVLTLLPATALAVGKDNGGHSDYQGGGQSQSAPNGIKAYVLQDSEEPDKFTGNGNSFGTTTFGVLFEDANGKRIDLGNLGGQTLTLTNNNQITLTDQTFAQASPAGYTYDGAYFIWGGTSLDTAGTDKMPVTAFQNVGQTNKKDSQNLSYNSALHYTSGESDYAYNPTGVLHVVYREATTETKYTVWYAEDVCDNTTLNTHNNSDADKLASYYSENSVIIAEPTKIDDYVFDRWALTETDVSKASISKNDDDQWVLKPNNSGAEGSDLHLVAHWTPESTPPPTPTPTPTPTPSSSVPVYVYAQVVDENDNALGNEAIQNLNDQLGNQLVTHSTNDGQLWLTLGKVQDFPGLPAADGDSTDYNLTSNSNMLSTVKDQVNGDNFDPYEVDGEQVNAINLGLVKWTELKNRVSGANDYEDETTNGDNVLLTWHLDGQISVTDIINLSVTKEVTEINDKAVTEDDDLTAEVGDTITWTITVSNSGCYDALINAPTDVLNPDEDGQGTELDVETDATPDSNGKYTVSANGSITFTATYTVAEDDAGKILTNVATVPGSAPGTAPDVTVNDKYAYTVEYYFDDVKGNAPTGASNGGTAEYGMTVTVEPYTSVTVVDDNYVLVSTVHSVTITIDTSKNVIKVCYEKDNWDAENDKETDGDDTPDSQQALIKYVAEDGGSVTPTVQVETLDANSDGDYVGTANVSSTAKADDNYAFDYWVDPNNSKSYTPELSGTLSVAGGKEYTYTAHFDTDVKGDPNDPENGGDDIPDKYQVKVTFEVENGAWDNKTTADVVKYVTLTETVTDEDGKESKQRSETGSYTLTEADGVPTAGNEPNEGYGSLGSWSTLSVDNTNKTPVGEVITAKVTYTYTYPKGTPIITAKVPYKVNHHVWNTETEEYDLKDTDTVMGEVGKKVTATAKQYEGYTLNTQTSVTTGTVIKPVVDTTNVTNPDNAKITMLVLNLYYDVDVVGDTDDNGDDIGDEIPDKYQVKVTFEVENGAWNDGTKTDVVKYVTLTDNDGNWSETGSYTLTADDVPAVGNEPDDGYKVGKWDVNPESNTVTAESIYTYAYTNQTVILTVTKIADQKTTEVGDTITWTIKVTNNGEMDLFDLTLDDTMSGVTVYDKNGNSISSTYTFDLAVGATAEFTAKYTVRASDEGKRLSNTVIVTVPGDPDDPDDDQKFEDTSDPVKVDEEEEGPYESLLVRKSVDNKTPEVGDTIEYTIKVTNTGDTTLRKVTVKDVLKNAAGSISVDEDDLPTGVTYNEKQGSFTIKTLGINKSVTITYTYEVLRTDAGKTLTNTVSASSGDAFDREEETVKVKKDSTPSVTPTTPVETDKPTLNIEDHVAYIIGYTDGTVRPENNITRAEVATIFFRLLTDESRARYWSQTNEYSDVNSGDWFNNAISTLSNAGIITGYPNGAFQPNAPITRAEFSTIAARFSDVVYSGSSSFIDVSASHWAARYIALAEYLGWITGYPDGTFKPDQNITRAEAMTLINRVLERAVEEQHMLPDMVAWIDNLPDAWYYEAVQEATNSHEYFRLFTLVPGQDFRYEHWQEILNVPDWAALEKAWSTVNGK